MKDVIYEPHPISAKRKAELITKGYRIIDARFAPKDYEHPDAKKGKAARRADAKPEGGGDA